MVRTRGVYADRMLRAHRGYLMALVTRPFSISVQTLNLTYFVTVCFSIFAFFLGFVYLFSYLLRERERERENLNK